MKAALNILAKFVGVAIAIPAILIFSSVVSRAIGLIVYELLGTPTGFHFVWRWSSILGLGLKIVPDPNIYLSPAGGKEHLVLVIAVAGLGTFAVFLSCFWLVKKVKSEWRLLIEPLLLIAAHFQLLASLFLISDYYQLNWLMLAILLLIIVIPLLLFRYCYYEKMKNWLWPMAATKAGLTAK